MKVSHISGLVAIENFNISGECKSKIVRDRVFLLPFVA